MLEALCHTPMRAFYSDHFVLPLPAGHRFPMEKYARLRTRVLTDGIVAADRLLEAPAATWDELRLAHDGAYVQAVASGTLAPDIQRRIGFPWSPGMVERSRRSAGATIAAARAAFDDGVAVNLAGGTHHSFSDRGEGYCVFNDVAIAARVMQREARAARIAVVDCDVHQGNGTAAIFRHDPSVFTFSMHGEKNFPFRKERSDLDVELADGTGDDGYLAALEAHLPRVLAHHEPDLVFYLAGADPYEGDRLGRLKLTFDGLARRDRFVFAQCLEARVPVAVAMSGGYAPAIDDIVRIHAQTVTEAAAHATRWHALA